MQPSELETLVKRQSWEWLFDLPARLNVAIEVLDDRHMPMFPAGHAPAATALRHLLTAGEPALAAAISEVLRSATPAPVAVNGLQGLCVVLSQGGVLVLARESGGDEPEATCLRDLESIGSWLAAALEASFTKAPGAIAVEPYRMASLDRILREAMSRGSVRGVIGAFVEALGVWDDVRIRCYAEGASGGLLPYVSPVGTPALPELDRGIVPRDRRMRRLGVAEIDRAGLPATDDVLILRLDVPCVLVFAGAIDADEQVRLTVYSDMLRESLRDALAATATRVSADTAGPHLPLDEPLQAAVQLILGRLSAAIGAGQAALVVTAASGGQVLAVGEADLLAVADQEGRSDRLVVRSTDAGGTLTIVLAREPLPFARFEREIIQGGMSALHSWLQAALQGAKAGERRRQFRPVDALFDALAAEAAGAGQHVSVIVVSVDAAALRPGLVQTWLGRTRAQLRGGDFAGVLSDTEIAVLLCDASTDHAAAVSARLKQLIQSDDTPDGGLQPAFGITTRSPSASFEGSLVGAARAGAALVR